jgi:uncharacterized protein YehS (DUF1456 family)
MTYNDILRRFRYAINLNDSALIEIFKLVNAKVTAQELDSYFKREDDGGYCEISAELMAQFLDGLIIYTRGKRAGDNSQPVVNKVALNNNVILKKIRIALELREEDMLEVFSAAKFALSKAELSALFRKQGHKNYKDCGDQILRNFLNGLTIHNRK